MFRRKTPEDFRRLNDRILQMSEGEVWAWALLISLIFCSVLAGLDKWAAR